jgi:hypothetical protein
MGAVLHHFGVMPGENHDALHVVCVPYAHASKQHVVGVQRNHLALPRNCNSPFELVDCVVWLLAQNLTIHFCKIFFSPVERQHVLLHGLYFKICFSV